MSCYGTKLVFVEDGEESKTTVLIIQVISVLLYLISRDSSARLPEFTDKWHHKHKNKLLEVKDLFKRLSSNIYKVYEEPCYL